MSVGVSGAGGGVLTQAQPALVHVHAEGGDEAQPQVVAQRPCVGAAAQVPAHQGAVDGGVGQHRLGPRVEVVEVYRTAVLLQVQTPGRKGRGEEQAQSWEGVSRPPTASPGLEGLHFGGLWRLVGLDGQNLDGAAVRGSCQVVRPLTEGQRVDAAPHTGVGQHRPAGTSRQVQSSPQAPPGGGPPF